MYSGLFGMLPKNFDFEWEIGFEYIKPHRVDGKTKWSLQENEMTAKKKTKSSLTKIGQTARKWW